MEALIDFAKGPLFRFSLAIMILGLVRLVLLTIFGAWKANWRAGDKTLRWGYITRYSLYWIFPFNKLFKHRPVYSIISILFHVGLILVPIFLYSHVMLWDKTIHLNWFTLSKNLADFLTVTTIVSGIILLVFRLSSMSSRFLSRKQDYLWPILLIIPFITGFLAANGGLNPIHYRFCMLLHFLSADLIFLLIPFTKIAHCILFPFSQLVSAQGWRFPANYGYDVAKTLEREELPI